MSAILIPKYRFMPLDEMLRQPLQIDWLVEDYIPSDSIGMIFGASGSGKSHIALSIAVAVANGSDWFGHKVKQGNVLVMAGEGNNGLNRRLQAIQKQHKLKIDANNICFSERAVGLDTETGFDEVINAINALDQMPDLIIIDTLSRHLLASAENSNDDMAQFINKLETIRQQYKCAILVVHHTGKSSELGARGASAIKANIDFSFAVASDSSKHCSLSCDKQKDADDDIPDKFFKIIPVELEKTKEGKPITGACIIKTDKTISLAQRKKTTKDIALETFDSDKTTWQKKFVEASTDKATDDSKKKRFREAVKKLEEENLIKQQDDKSYQLKSA